MPEEHEPIYDKRGRIVGYRPKDPSGGRRNLPYEVPKGKGPSVGERELKTKGAPPMPKQSDYPSTREWMDAVRKWREAQRTAQDGADALIAKKKD